ncbi:hypothetical protein [Fodinibius saliphilus]|uniref:hypothetical protein n=1 Tax=Fodinibius saliphilus TaxID=1920650 RepID=UPI0014875C8B|nr:hypothetical protein [Fodinibius saliphilus]
MAHHPHNLILGCKFASRTTARYIREFAGENVKITCIVRNPYLVFIPNIPLEVLAHFIGQEEENYKPKEGNDPLEFTLISMDDLGGHKGFYMHNDEWWGNYTSVLKIGYTPHLLKMRVKSMYYTLVAKYRLRGLPIQSS